MLSGCLGHVPPPDGLRKPYGANQQAALGLDGSDALDLSARAKPIPLPRRKPEHLRGPVAQAEALRRGDDLVAALPLPPAQSNTLATTAAQEESSEAAIAPRPLELEEIETLVGTSFASVEAALGRPAISEVRAPAEIWTYSGSGCALLLYFYPSVSDSRYRLLAYELKGGVTPPDQQRACARDILSQKAQAQPALPVLPGGLLDETSQPGPGGQTPLRP